MTAADSRVGTSFGKYRFTGLLGKGGMGEVYSAYDTDKDRTVALKVLADPYSTDERFRMRFMQESRCAARLQEPHIIPIHDWGEIDGSLFIDMRLVRGSTLWELLEKGPLEPARAVNRLLSAVSGMPLPLTILGGLRVGRTGFQRSRIGGQEQ